MFPPPSRCKLSELTTAIDTQLKMKKNKHPQLSKLLVFLSNGTTCEMRTTINGGSKSTPSPILKLEYDSKNNKNNYHLPSEAGHYDLALRPLRQDGQLLTSVANERRGNDFPPSPDRMNSPSRATSLLRFSTMVNKLSVR